MLAGLEGGSSWIQLLLLDETGLVTQEVGRKGSISLWEVPEVSALALVLVAAGC